MYTGIPNSFANRLANPRQLAFEPLPSATLEHEDKEEGVGGLADAQKAVADHHAFSSRAVLLGLVQVVRQGDWLCG